MSPIHTTIRSQVLREMDIPNPKLSDGKTPLMRLLEARTGIPIEEIVAYGSVRELGKELGVHWSTISKWRARFGAEGG